MNELKEIANTTEIERQAGELVSAYLAQLDARQKTKDTYRKAVNRFFVWLMERGGGTLTRADILLYKGYLTKNYSASTVSAYLTALRSFFKYLESENYCYNVAAGVKGAEKSRGHKKDILTKEQAKAVLSAVDRTTPEGLRDYAIINLLMRTGLRTVEVERANYEDIRQEAGQPLLYIQGKGRSDKDDFIVLTPATLDPIREYISSTGGRKEKEPIFQSMSNRSTGGRLTTRSISRIVKNAMRVAGIDSDRLTAHSLRHGAITYALMSGATLQEAQQLARHSNINTTIIYAHNLQRISSAPESRIDNFLDV